MQTSIISIIPASSQRFLEQAKGTPGLAADQRSRPEEPLTTTPGWLGWSSQVLANHPKSPDRVGWIILNLPDDLTRHANVSFSCCNLCCSHSIVFSRSLCFSPAAVLQTLCGFSKNVLFLVETRVFPCKTFPERFGKLAPSNFFEKRFVFFYQKRVVFICETWCAPEWKIQRVANVMRVFQKRIVFLRNKRVVFPQS